jgi:hypothetical protein
MMLTIAGWLLSTSVAHALERTSARADAVREETWSAAAQTCTIRYYNNCIGWLWVWKGWSPGERHATVFESCCQNAQLELTSHLVFEGVAHGGWGFTGTIGVFEADASDCATGPPIAQRPWLAPHTSWYSHTWNVAVPSRFMVQVNWGAPAGLTDPAGMSSDRPAGGPTGPQALGLCFPSSRTVHSYHWQPGDFSCPGPVENDGVGDVEWLAEARLACPVHTTPRSWGRIKTLYE